MTERELDLVLLGATGFTGGLTADYLAEHVPDGVRWGIAGRDPAKLAVIRDRLVAAHPDRPGLADLALVPADVSDAGSLAALAARTRVLATTVGPYLTHGEPVVAACAEAGTDYVDLTGEPEFVDTMYVRYDAVARATGARIVHACGFDSVPHDLGALFTVNQLAAVGPVRLRGIVRAKAGLSGGTFHSALEQFSRPRQLRAAAAARRSVERQRSATGQAAGERRTSRAVAGRLRRDPLLGYWLVPLPTIDPMIVARSGAALAAYGPEFTYSHYAGTKTLRYAVGGIAAVGALALGAQIGPVRDWLGRRLPQGAGPASSRRDDSWFTVDFVGEGDGRTIHTRVSGGDPGYTETSRMLAESALSLALDDNPPTAGCVTTAQAMGERLTARLISAGLRFEVLT